MLILRQMVYRTSSSEHLMRTLQISIKYLLYLLDPQVLQVQQVLLVEMALVD